MNITNHTDYQAKVNPGLMPDGRTCLIVVIKATYNFPKQANTLPDLAEEQIDAYESDEFTGEPGYSSPLYENDYATYKPRCDVIIQSPVAYAPNGEPSQRVEVGLQCGTINKRFAVVGKRYWEKAMLGMASRPTEPQAFTEQTLNWEIAYGGVDESAYEEEDLSESYLPNPVGTGFWHDPTPEQVENTPLAQTEALNQGITKPNQRHIPQGFGPVARNWQPRSDYGGTYDKHWEENTKPFLPDDFDSRYYQCAPADQQMDYPRGGEVVVLENLSPEGFVELTLPSFKVPVMLHLTDGNVSPMEPVIDTLTIDMASQQFTLVARTLYPVKNTLHEVDEFIVGTSPEDDSDEAPYDEDFTDSTKPRRDPVQYYGQETTRGKK